MSDQVPPGRRLADCSKIIYIYIYTHTQNSLFGRSDKDMVLDRFWIGFWIGFGEVIGLVLEKCLRHV